MPGTDFSPDPHPDLSEVTADLVRLMPRDAVFMLRFLGESQERLLRHFQDFIGTELARLGITQDSHPMIHGFIETHALTLRDFVFSGLSMGHQLRLSEMERLLGDTTSLLSVDIWDELRGHIEMAQAQFASQAPALPRQLESYRVPPR